MKCLLVGAGVMAIEYAKVLSALGIDFDVVGRSKRSADNFCLATGKPVLEGGIELFLNKGNVFLTYDCAIIAVNVELLYEATMQVLRNGIKRVLVEKPGAMCLSEINALAEFAEKRGAEGFIAYNRRFYQSVMETKKMIIQDGGVSSFSFEFSELGFRIKDLEKTQLVLDNWLLANSTHVIDLAFFLGGKPKRVDAFVHKGKKWYERVYAGAGVTVDGILFSYNANWMSPGRWGVEILTPARKFYLRPLESLQITSLGSFECKPYDLSSDIDKRFKPGLYCQVKSFVGNQTAGMVTFREQYDNMKWYEIIDSGNS